MPDQSLRLRARLMTAIHTETLAPVALALAAENVAVGALDTQLVAAAQQVCARIRTQLLEEGRALESLLTDAAIPCRFDDARSELSSPQYHRFALAVDVGNPTRSVELLASQDYRCPIPLGEMYWESFRRNHSEICLTRIDDASTRLDLHWRSGSRSKAWGPGPGFVLAHPAKVLRAALRRVSRRMASPIAPDPHHLGELLCTPRQLLAPLLRFAEFTPQDVRLDIGCGDGRVLIEAVRATGCRGIGLEVQADICAIAQAHVREARLESAIEIRCGDTRDAPLRTATKVFLFIPARTLGSYLPSLLSSLRAGTRVIVHEQVALEGVPPPDHSEPLIGHAAVTVAHRWDVA